jgi:hypothetical protein
MNYNIDIPKLAKTLEQERFTPDQIAIILMSIYTSIIKTEEVKA